ncbi:hypothetical protein L7F22_048539 [Adiantum nelumboides]|nr:hypothetical protein [Adiantum nelumboides]
MEEAEGVLSFDFERGLAVNVQANYPEGEQAVSTVAAAAVGQVGDPTAASAEGLRPGNRRSIRQTVCRHWLRGLCMKGDVCPYLHQLDHARMPICRFYARYGECREPDCIFKHTFEDAKECHMYMLGFCPNGPDCRYKHVKLPGPVPSLEETYKKIQQRLAAAFSGTQSTRYMAQRQGTNSLQGDVKVFPASQAETAAANTTESQNLQEDPPPLSSVLHPLGTKEAQRAISLQVTPPLPVGMPATQLPPFISASTPLPQGSSRYFVVKSCNRENLDLSVTRGMWATHRNNEAKLNEAFDSCDNVILVFSVNETSHFQGCARMMSRIGVISGGGSWKYADGNVRYGRNFVLKWLKLCELSFHKTWHLRNTYNENLPVKISRDCQELEPTVGEQLASLLYEEPDSDLMKAANEAEAKRGEEANTGVSAMIDLDGADGNQLDNDDYRDEEVGDEDISTTPIVNLSNEDCKRAQASRRATLPFRRAIRGRGRGLMSCTYTMGFDSLAANPTECFALPGTGMGRGFPPYYPLQRYGGQMYPSVGPRSALGFGPIDPSSGMPFPVSRPPNGLYSSKGLNIMGPPGAPRTLGTRLRNMPTALKTRPGPTKLARLLTKVSQNGSRCIGRTMIKNEQKRARNDIAAAGVAGMRNTAKQANSSSAGGTLGFGSIEAKQAIFARNFVSNEVGESSSEDEAPRRSRYGEGKKRRENGHGDHLQGEHWAGNDRPGEVAF